ncbi:MAG: metallophosphoesterase family protein [Candidatus Heimdallarchaeaceae archaeon]
MKKEILKEFGLTEKQLRNILIKQHKPTTATIDKYFGGNKFKFAVVSDTHLCSKYERLDALNTFYRLCKRQGITDVYHAGDLITGQKLFRGMEYEIHTIGVDNQVRYCIDNYPKVKGITTYFITGNHDLSYYKDLGIDVGNLISEKRPDMVYLGQWQTDIVLNGVRIRLLHPDKGGAYAVSYQAQKIAEQIQSGKKPQVIFFGHWHSSIYFLYRNIHIFCAGAFEDQTPYLMRKGINPILGGWIVTVKTTDDDRKSITSIVPQFVPFY